MAIENIQEYIKGKIQEIEKLNRRIEKINDVLFAGQEEKEVKGKTKVIPLTAERVDELNRKIDSAIKQIEDIQIEIEVTLVERSLENDDKAKDFVVKQKEKLNIEIEQNKEEIEEYKKYEEALEENKGIEEINRLIADRKRYKEQLEGLEAEKNNIENENKALEQEIQELEEVGSENIQLAKEMRELEEKLNDPNLSEDEKKQIQEQINEKENLINENLQKMEEANNIAAEKRKQIKENNKRYENIDKSVETRKQKIIEAEKRLNELGITDLDETKLDTLYNENQPKIEANNKIINNVRKNLKIEPEKENDIEYIKEKAKEEIDKKLAIVKDLEEKASKIDEEGFKKKIKENIISQYGGKDNIAIEEVVDNVVKERKQKLIDERRAARTAKAPERGEEGKGVEGAGSGAVTTTAVTKTPSSYYPTFSSLKPAERHFGEKVGFFQNLRERYFSKDFKQKRKAFAKEMYPDLNDVELENYIDDNMSKLNYLIRTGTTIADVKEGVKIQKEIRKERLDKIRNNSFLEKLKVNLGDKDALENVISEHAQEKAKAVKDMDISDD